LVLQDYVIMPGFVGNPYQYMRHAKVFVQSSIREGFSNGLIEAMPCGTQIVATDCVGGTAEILGFGKFGHLVSVDDHEEMAKILLLSLNSLADNSPLIKAKDIDITTVLDLYTEVL